MKFAGMACRMNVDKAAAGDPLEFLWRSGGKFFQHHAQLNVALDKKAHEWVAEKGYDPVFGARPLKRFLQRNIETKLARGLISGEIADGIAVTYTVRNDELAPVGDVADVKR